MSLELDTFCSHNDSQSKAPILLCKSVSSYRKEVKLTFELQGKCQKTRGLILCRKIRCFLKRTRFWTYFELPVGSSTVCKDFASKTLCFSHFCNFSADSSSKHVILEWKLPGLDTQKMTKWPTSRVFKINLKIINVCRNEKKCVIFAREFSTV